MRMMKEGSERKKKKKKDTDKDKDVDKDVTMKQDPMAGEERYTLKEFLYGNITSLCLRGIEGVIRTSLKTTGDGKHYIEVMRDKTKCLHRVMGVPGVDYTRTNTNDIFEALEFGGIEYAGAILQKEMKGVIAAYNINISVKHYQLVCNVMTHTGSVLAFSRHGVNRVEVKTLMRASFEKTCEVLHESARFNQLDDIRGVTECIILGKLAPIGTGKIEVYVPIPGTEAFDRLLSKPVPRPSIQDYDSRPKEKEKKNTYGIESLPVTYSGRALSPFVPSSPRRDRPILDPLVFESFPSRGPARPIRPTSPRR